MKNPCSSCQGSPARETNPPEGGGGHGGGGRIGFVGGWPWWGGWPYYGYGGWPYAAPYSYAAAAPATSEWLPATKGPAPAGASVWILWTGGSTGTKVYANSSISQQVSILETAKGGPTGTLVRVAPLAPSYPVAPTYPAYGPYAYAPYAYSFPTAAVVVRRA